MTYVEEIYHAARLVSLDERGALISELSKGDVEIQREVESLLSFDEVNSTLIDNPPSAIAAEFLSGGPPVERVGTTIGHYKIVSKLGTGGMGDVFLAEDTMLDREIAIKFIKPEFAREPDKMSRFLWEAKSASGLNHPNIITVYEIGEYQGFQFIATEYIEGQTLREVMNSSHCTPGEVVHIASQIAAALHTAHSAGIHHRDIKPENIMLRHDGLIKILDFGLAKLIEESLKPIANNASDNVSESVSINGATLPGLMMGTAAYMSPEQVQLEPLDGRSDIWSLGVVLYEIVAGKKPFAGKTSVEMASSIINDEPFGFEGEIDPEFAELILKCISKDPVSRFHDARELLVELQRIKLVAGTAGEFEGILTDSGSFEFDSKHRSQEPHRTTRTNEISNAEFIVQKVKKNWLLTSAVTFLLLVSVLAFGYSRFYAVSDTSQFRSVAVLPFSNETGDSKLDYISEGISDSLIDRLSQLPQLKVIARSSSFQFNGKRLDIQRVHDHLEVQTIVAGRVTKKGENITITYELIDASNKSRIWGDSYEKNLSDLQFFDEDIAKQIFQKLRVNLSDSQKRQIAKRRTHDSKAFQHYLNGVYYRRKTGIENLKISLKYFDQALDIDPNFALVHAERAIIYSAFAENGVVDPKGARGRDRAAAEKALALDESLADAHLALARIKTNEFDWKGAEKSIKRSIALNPNLARAHHYYAGYFMRLKRFEEALREIRIAQQLDPLEATLVTVEGQILCWSGRYKEAHAVLERSKQMQPANSFTHAIIGMTYAGKKQYEKASEAWLVAENGMPSPTTMIYSGSAFARAGKTEKARDLARKLNATSEYVSPVELAIIYTALGDIQNALDLIEKGYAQRDLQLQFLRAEPEFEELQNEPRFKAVLEKIGL